ncbi:hypothetical protein V6N11_075592 [Hibiscus sabdariffa]|uniref:Uncharacterized protein n=1 Tax=Hibiscus sabdariffa TaxID=183260 RepID=A0ABR2R7F1_9ROSI
MDVSDQWNTCEIRSKRDLGCIAIDVNTKKVTGVVDELKIEILRGHIDNGIMDEFVSHVINSEKNDGVGVAYAGSNSGDMVVPNSFRAPNSRKINHLWEDNIREDLRIVEPRSEAQECMLEENVRLTVWAGDKYTEPYLVASVQEIDIVVLKPSEAIPRNRS